MQRWKSLFQNLRDERFKAYADNEGLDKPVHLWKVAFAL